MSHFSLKMSKEKPLQPLHTLIINIKLIYIYTKHIIISTVNGDRYRATLNEFLFTKMATFDFNRTTLSATQPKLHSMFCALFLKTALLAAVLMPFGHLGAAI